MEVYSLDASPHTAAALQINERLLGKHPELQVYLTRVKDEVHAAEICFRRLPKILIDRMDCVEMPVPAVPLWACRFYPKDCSLFKN